MNRGGLYLINRFNSVTFLCLHNVRTWISNDICRDRGVQFIDIGEIVDRHCLIFVILIIKQ